MIANKQFITYTIWVTNNCCVLYLLLQSDLVIHDSDHKHDIVIIRKGKLTMRENRR